MTMLTIKHYKEIEQDLANEFCYHNSKFNEIISEMDIVNRRLVFVPVGTADNSEIKCIHAGYYLSTKYNIPVTFIWWSIKSYKNTFSSTGIHRRILIGDNHDDVGMF